MITNLTQKPVAPIFEEDPTVDIKEVCRQIGASERSIYRAIASGEFPKPAKLPGVNRWFQSDINTYLRRAKDRRD